MYSQRGVSCRRVAALNTTNAACVKNIFFHIPLFSNQNAAAFAVKVFSISNVPQYAFTRTIRNSERRIWNQGIRFAGRNIKKEFKVDVNSGIVPDAERMLVYNYVSCQRPITWETFRKHVRAHGSKIPGVKDIRLQCMFWNSRLWLHKVLMCLLHLLPAVMVDAAAILTGRDPRSVVLLFPFFPCCFFFLSFFQIRFMDREISEPC